MNGGFTSWSKWGICKTSANRCGTGKRDRHRFCTNPIPRSLGMPCSGVYHETEQCERPCAPYGKGNLFLRSTEVL